MTSLPEHPRAALVLAAGAGTRLRPLTYARAKAAIPVAGETMIRRILGWLASQQVVDVVVNLHALPETIADGLGDGSDLGVRVRYSWEQPDVLGSAGGPRQAAPIIGTSPFFIVNGDTLTDVDLGRLAAAHRASGALVTLALAPHHEPGRYGGVRLDDSGRYAGVVGREAPQPSWHFTGVQLAEAAAFDSLPPCTPATSIGGLYDQLRRTSPGSVAGFVSHPTFWDVGTPQDYWVTSLAFAGRDGRTEPLWGRHVRISPSARVTRSILWDDVEVGAGAIVEECVVTDGVRIDRGATYRRQAIVRPRHGDGLIVSPLNLHD